MVSTMHLESFGGVNNWDWAKASKIKSGLRAPRRPKVYSAQNKKKTVERNLKDSEDLTSRSSKVGEMSVLESEKVGVSILGRRFSDSSENVPIKKRRYLRLQFPSPPCSPSHLPELPEASERSLACEGSGLSHLHHFDVEHQGSNSDMRMDSCLEKSVTKENTKCEIHDMPTDGADFSGISILATAACNSSSVGGDIIGSEASVARGQDGEVAHLISGKAESHDLQAEKLVDQQLNNANALGIKTSIPVASMATSVLSKEDEDANTTGESEVVEEQLCNSHSMLVSSDETVGKMSSARDGKFHWDLNKAIDTWEDSDAGLFDSEDPLLNGSSKDAVKSDGADMVQMGSGSVNSPSKTDHDAYMKIELRGIGSSKDFDVSAEKDLSFNHGNVSNCNTEGHSPSVVLIGDSAQSKHFVSEDLNKVGDERHASNDSRTEYVGCESVISSHGQSVDHPHETIAFENCSKPNCETFNETLCSQQDVISNTCAANENHHSEPSDLVKPPARVRVVQDSEQTLAVDTFNELSDDNPGNGPTTCTWNFHKQPDDSPKIDSKTVASTCTGDPPMSAALVSNDSVINKNSVKKFTGTDSCNIVGQSGLVENTGTSSGLCQCDPSEQLVGLMDEGSPIPVELSSASNCTVKGAGDSTNLKVQVQKSPAMVDANLNPELLDFVNDSDNKVTPIDYCSPSNHLKDAIAVVKISGENCSSDHSDFGSDSVSSQHNLEKQAETEKDEPHGDDDSQYEDGEFRVSAVLDWQLDGSEGEAEHVDYGSDSNRDDELVASSPNCHSFVGQPSLGEAGAGHKSEKTLEVGSLHSLDDQTSTWVAPKHLHGSNIGAEKKKPLVEKIEREHSRGHGSEQSTRDVNDDLQVSLNSKIVVGCELNTENSDDTKALSHSASSKMKSSGWDCLQEHPKTTQVAVAETRSDGTEANQSVAADSHKNAGSMPRSDISSKIGRSKSSELSQRKSQAHLPGKGVNPGVSATRIERDGSRTSSTRRDGSSLHRHDRRSRAGDACDGPSGQWGPGSHKSPSTHESSGFNQSKLKNDAAAVKLKSNGFNAAPVGTVEQRSVGCVSRTSRQNGNPSLQAPRQSLPKGVSPKERNESSDIDRSFDFGHSREASPDRHVGTSRGRPGRYDPRVASADHRERYVEPISGEGIDSSPSIRNTFSRRECNYSPRRNSIRTWNCPPQVWTSPRRRDDGGVNGLRRWSRSPDFRSPSYRVSPNERNDSSDLDRSLDFVRSRDRSPDRHLIPSRGRPGRYDPRAVSVDRRERWKRFPEPISGDGIDSSLPMCHAFPRRDHNYSPQRNSINMWTRSPHVWMSPRRKGDNGDMNDLKRSRYPNMRSGERGERMRLPPQQQPRYMERMPDAVPSSGGNVSPPHPLRWIEHRKDLEQHFGEHEYRQSSGRNHPPGRPYSRDHRFDMENSHIEAEYHHHSSDPGRLHDFPVGRRQRSGGRNNNRGHDGRRFDMFDCPPEEYDVDDMKHVNYDIDDGFRLNDSRLDFDGGSPREFDRGMEDHLDGPPRRLRDHGRPFRYRREARDGNSFGSFRIRECDDDVNQRRRLA